MYISNGTSYQESDLTYVNIHLDRCYNGFLSLILIYATSIDPTTSFEEQSLFSFSSLHNTDCTNAAAECQVTYLFPSHVPFIDERNYMEVHICT
jgi:hypothetical protein